MAILEKTKKTGRNLYTTSQEYYDKITGNKAIKKESLENLKVTTSSGKVFYGDPTSRSDISDAIDLAEETGQTTTYWKLAEPISGSKVVEVSKEELKEARMLALQAKASIIGV